MCMVESPEVSVIIAGILLLLCQIAALQQTYDGLCIKSGTTAVPYFLMKYTDDIVQLAPLGDWDKFFTDAKKVCGFSSIFSTFLKQQKETQK